MLAVRTAGKKNQKTKNTFIVHCERLAADTELVALSAASFLISLNLVFVLVRPPNWLPTAVGTRLEHGLGMLLSAAD